MNEKHPGEIQGGSVLDLETARKEKRRQMMQRMYDLEEEGSHLLGLLSEEALNPQETRDARQAARDLVQAWSTFAHELASFNEQEWLSYRSERED